MWKAVRLGLVSFVCVVPVLIYGYLAFRPTDPALWTQARDILVNDRLARHAVPSTWLGFAAYLKLAVVLAGLYAVRRTRLFWVLGIGLAVAAGGAMLQMLTTSPRWRCVYPWRMSVLLVLASSPLLRRRRC
jgi:hypothetical protein